MNEEIGRHVKMGSEQVGHPLEVLDRLFFLNSVRQWVPVSRFYNKAVLNWLEVGKQQAFNFMAYPFLLSLEVKASLLHM